MAKNVKVEEKVAETATESETPVVPAEEAKATTAEDITSKMNASAEEARQELLTMLADTTTPAIALIDWWKKWYPKAGHKRLGRTLAKWGK